MKVDISRKRRSVSAPIQLIIKRDCSKIKRAVAAVAVGQRKLRSLSAQAD